MVHIEVDESELYIKYKTILFINIPLKSFSDKILCGIFL